MWPVSIVWEVEDARLTASEALIETGRITIDEHPELDLACVRLRPDLGAEPVPGFPGERLDECHPFALHTRTERTRLLLIQDRRIELQYRYEGWVQMASRRPAPRVDLSGLASELNQQEDSGGCWTFDGVDRITPRLHLQGRSSTSIDPDASYNV